MKTTKFQSLLLRAAVVAMAAADDIAEVEKSELSRLAGSTAYFLGYDHAKALPGLLVAGHRTKAIAQQNKIEQYVGIQK